MKNILHMIRITPTRITLTLCPKSIKKTVAVKDYDKWLTTTYRSESAQVYYTLDGDAAFKLFWDKSKKG